MIGGVQFNDYARELLYCDGIKWRRVVYGSTGMITASPAEGYFVLTETTWNGNLGGQSGADDLCLTELTTKTNWRGYSDAQARGLLTSVKVKAFLCTGDDICNLPMPQTTYRFARVGSTTDGGGSFTPNDSSQGPFNSDNWSSAQHFGTTATYWTGRADNGGALTYWSLNPGNSGGGCVYFTSTGGQGPTGTSNSTGIARWRIATGSRPLCTTSHALLCMVHP
jgi:hypothetical protein